MRLIPFPQDGVDRLDAAYLQQMIIGPTDREFDRLRRLVLPTGLFRHPTAKRFNEGALRIDAILSRAPLTVRFDCPAFSGLTPDGEYLECDAFRPELVLPTRGEFALYLVRSTPELPPEPVAPPVLVPERFAVATRGGLAIARGSIGPDSAPVLDGDWIPPTATVTGSRPVEEAVARLRTRLGAIDRRLLGSARTERTRLFLHRWTPFYAAWRALGDSTRLDDYLVQTTRLLDQMRADTQAIFGAGELPPIGPADTLAQAFLGFDEAVNGLARRWEVLFEAPLTTAIELIEQPAPQRVGAHAEYVLRTRGPIPFAAVTLVAEYTGRFGAEVARVLVDPALPPTTARRRYDLTAPAPGRVTCRIDLTPEERAAGRVRMFVRQELGLSAITLEGA